MRDAGSMATQMIECAEPTQCVVPTSQPNPTEAETHRKIPFHRPEDIQQTHTMPNRTCTHWRVLNMHHFISFSYTNPTTPPVYQRTQNHPPNTSRNHVG